MGEDRVSEAIIVWYNLVKRELPWRDTKDPYRIWISEIILQQTRVAQGYEFYMRFVQRFPTVVDLANAHEDEVLKLWQGLGYYSRARNLHAAAKQVKQLYNGDFPNKYKDVRALKGVGDYTAAAICSFSYGMPYAVVDGNVYRVLSRLYDIDLAIDSSEGKKYFAELAQLLLSKTDPATHNQALMELGALQCTPRTPDCRVCPVAIHCLAFEHNTVMMRPVKSKQTVVKSRYFHYFRIQFQDYIYLKQRVEKDIWRNLFEFPLIETLQPMTLIELSSSTDFRCMFDGFESVDFRLEKQNVIHVLSHRRIIANFYTVVVSNENEALAKYIKIETDDFQKYAVSQLITKLTGE